MRGSIIVALLLAFVPSGAANAGRTTLGQIREAIRAKGAKWTAGTNPVFELSEDEQMQLCGLLFTDLAKPESSASSHYGDGLTGVEIPSSYDWRGGVDADGVVIPSIVTPVRDQLSCGSCWAFGALAGMESAMILEGDGTVSDLDLAEQFLVSCDDSNYGCCGGYMDRVYDYLMTHGTTDEDCFAYEGGTCTCNRRFCRDSTASCGGACPDAAARMKRISGWEWVGPTDSEGVPTEAAMKNAVLEFGVVTVGMNVYEDFFAYDGGVYEYSYGELAGGHAVAIVGWGEAEGATPAHWIVKNSWGADWGEGGFFRIKIGDYSRIGRDAATFTYMPCYDADGDGHQDASCGGSDCDDADAATNPDAEEACGDGVDNDCDGHVDGEDVAEVCDDLVDNDCDGAVDGDDTEDCGGPSPCGVKGDPCASDNDCCSLNCFERRSVCK